MDHPPTITTQEGTWYHWRAGLYQLEGRGLAWGRHWIEKTTKAESHE